MYNQNYINDFNEQDYLDALNNSSKLKIVAEEYINEYSGKSNVLYLAFKESLDHYILKRLKTEPDFINSTLFSHYMEYITYVGLKNKTTINDNLSVITEFSTNVVFKDPVLRNAISNKYWTRPDIKSKIENSFESNEIRLDTCIKKLNNKEELSPSQLNYLAEYLHKTHDMTSNTYQNFVEYVLNRVEDKDHVSQAVINAVISYLPFNYSEDTKVSNSRMFIGSHDSVILDYKDLHTKTESYILGEGETLKSVALKNKIDINTLINLNTGAYKAHGTNGILPSNRRLYLSQKGNDFSFAHSSGLRRYCAFEADKIRNASFSSSASLNTSRTSKENDIYFWIMCSFHELSHEHQKNMMYNNELNSSGLAYIVRNVLNDKLNDYGLNHDADEIEMEADEKGWSETLKLLHTHIDFSSYSTDEDKIRKQGDVSFYERCFVNRKAVHARRGFTYKKDKDNNSLMYYDYDILNLEQIVSKDPSIISKYPMLRKIFNQNGEIDSTFLLNQVVTKEESDQIKDNNAGLEVGSYIARKRMGPLKDYIKNNDLTSDQIHNLRVNMWDICHQNVLKIREIKQLDKRTYEETKSNFDFDKIHELYNIYFRNALIEVYNACHIFTILNQKYPGKDYMEEFRNYYVRWFIEAFDNCKTLDRDKVLQDLAIYDKTGVYELLALSNYAKEGLNKQDEYSSSGVKR